jgi:hypothetical protein
VNARVLVLAFAVVALAVPTVSGGAHDPDVDDPRHPVEDSPEEPGEPVEEGEMPGSVGPGPHARDRDLEEVRAPEDSGRGAFIAVGLIALALGVGYVVMRLSGRP